MSLLSRRVLDVAACCADAGVRVSLNGQAVSIHSFEQYIDAYQLGYPAKVVKASGDKKKSTATETALSAVTEEPSSGDGNTSQDNISPAAVSRFVFARNNLWTVAVRVVPATGEATQVSFVNSIATSRGGTCCNFDSVTHNALFKAGINFACALFCSLCAAGTHVAFITDQIARRVHEHISKKHKDINVTLGQVRESICLNLLSC